MKTTIPVSVQFISCRNDTGARLAVRLLGRLGDPRLALATVDDVPPEIAVILCPPDCDT